MCRVIGHGFGGLPTGRFRAGRLAGALFIAYAVEFSQLYQAEWLNVIWATRLGGLLLGHGFVWSDLLAYGVGIAAAAGVDYFFRR